MGRFTVVGELLRVAEVPRLIVLYFMFMFEHFR